jgi:hypothetical protein
MCGHFKLTATLNHMGKRISFWMLQIWVYFGFPCRHQQWSFIAAHTLITLVFPPREALFLGISGGDDLAEPLHTTSTQNHLFMRTRFILPM